MSQIIKYNSILLLLTVIILLFSCSNQTEHREIIIDITHNSNSLPIQLDTIIELEMTEQSMIGEIHKIRHFKDRYFVMDYYISRNIFMFDNQGNFLSTLQRGKGIGEVVRPSEFIINPHTKTIWVWDQALHRLSEYDLNLNFKQSKQFPELYIKAAEIIDNERLLINSPVIKPNEEKQNYNLYSIFNLKTWQYESQFFPFKKELIGVGTMKPISATSERILFSSTFNNHLYTLTKDGYEIAYRFNFGNKTISSNDIEKGVDYVYKQSAKGNIIMPFYNIDENKNYLSFNFSYKTRDNFIIYAKNSKKYVSSINLVEKGILPNCRLNSCINNTQFLAFASPMDVQYFLSNKTANANSESIKIKNPYLILFSINET